jgi:sulfate permease, SulP family
MMNHLKEWALDRSKTFKDDFIAGLIVAVVALPLAIGFAIASNVPPAMGIYTAIVAGFFAAIFGGSAYQISGPTGAMVVVILSVLNRYGMDGLIVATLLAGLIILLLGLFKLGKIIEYIPSPVIVGFTAGIAVLVFIGQFSNFLGVYPTAPANAEVPQKALLALEHIAQAYWPAVILALLTLAILIVVPRINRKIPGSIVAVIITTVIAVAFPVLFAVKTVGDMGAIPQSLPLPHLPHLNWQLIWNVLPGALTIAALGAIESLLSAVVGDGLTGTRHNPNKELVGQGLANIASSLFGGMPATGAIARTATNIRNGAKTRLSGVFHALILLVFILAIGSAAARIPLAAIAGILMYVAFNMVEWERIHVIFRTPLSDVLVMLTTFLITVFVDLTTAIEVGLVLAAVLFMKRMSDLYRVDELEGDEEDSTAELVRGFRHPDISIYTVNGPLFFGAASRFDQQVATTPGGHKPIKIIRMKHVPVIDATGLSFLESTWHKHHKRGGTVLFATVHPDVMKVIEKTGLKEKIGPQHFFATTRTALVHALRHAHRLHHRDQSVTPEELAQYHLTTLDAEDRQPMSKTRDKDPVEEMLESVGVMKLHDAGREAMQQTMKTTKAVVEPAIASTIKATKAIHRNGQKTLKKTIKTTKDVMEPVIEPVEKALAEHDRKVRRAAKRMIRGR